MQEEREMQEERGRKAVQETMGEGGRMGERARKPANRFLQRRGRRFSGGFGLCSGLLVCALLAPDAALAQWAAKAEAGVVAARGNTHTDSANLKADVSRTFVKWKHALGFTGVYASDRTGTTGQRWEGRGQTDYAFNEQGYSFASGRYEEDRFSGFDYQATLGSGLGWRFFDTPQTKLEAQLGVGYKMFKARASIAADGITPIPATREEDGIAQGKVTFERALSETSRLFEKFLVESGAENTFMQNDLSLEVKIVSSLALAIGYSVRYNTAPPAGFGKTDTLTTLNLVYELKSSP